MQNRITIVTLILIASVLVSLLVSLLVVRIRRRLLRKKTDTEEDMATGNFEYQGIRYRQGRVPGGQHSPPFFQVMIPFAAGGKFRIKEETGFDRFFRKAGILRKIRTHAPEFDRRFQIESLQESRMVRLFQDARYREAVVAVFESGFNDLRSDGRHLRARIIPCRRNRKVPREVIHRVVEALDRLAEGLKASGHPVQESAGPWKFRTAFALGVPFLLLVAGTAALVLGLSRFAPLDPLKIARDSLKFSLPLMFLYLWAGTRLVAGRSSSHRVWPVMLVLSLLAFPLGGAGLEMFLNGRLDTSPPVIHRQPVRSRGYANSRSGTTYYLRVESWREIPATEKIRVNYKVYRQTRPGESLLIVTTRAGYFGFEWIMSYRLDE